MNSLTATRIGRERTILSQEYVCDRCGRVVMKSRAVIGGICGDCKLVDGKFWEGLK